MKRYFSVFLTVLLLVTMFPIKATAESLVSEQHDLIVLASQVFPEHASTILGENSTTNNRSRANDARKILFCETRPISENEEITYAQYDDGNGIIAYASAFNLTETGSSLSGFSAGTNGIVSYKITATDEYNYRGVFHLNNFKYTIYNNTYDCITDLGNAYSSSQTHLLFNRSTPVYQETSTKDANVHFNLTFIHFGSYGVTSSDDIYTTFSLFVGDNDFSVYLSD